MSDIEEVMAFQIRAFGLPTPEREMRFDAKRRWRFDFAWPADLLALEIEGGTASGKSRHSKGKGFERDCEKYNAAALRGWRVLRVTSAMVRDGRAMVVLSQALRHHILEAAA